MRKKKASSSVIAILAIPMLLLGVTFLERLLRLFPDEIGVLYVPLWLILLVACPLCGAISIGYSVIRHGSFVTTTLGVLAGLLQLAVAVQLFLVMDRMISLPVHM